MKSFLRILTALLCCIGLSSYVLVNAPKVSGDDTSASNQIIVAANEAKKGAEKVIEVGSIKQEIVEKPSTKIPEEKPVEKVEDTKINYSDTIQVLVTEEQRKKVDEQLSGLDNEITMLAKVMYREAGGIEEDSHKAAVAWCVLNRVDSEKYSNSISEVITAKYQFAWIPDTPVEEDLLLLAKDVVTRWLLEKEGIENVGRTLPQGYFFFNGDGQYNHFRQSLETNDYWDWSYRTPYED